jgi:hypothetical protein
MKSRAEHYWLTPVFRFKAGFVREARELAKTCLALAARLGIALDGAEKAGESGAEGWRAGQRR